MWRRVSMIVLGACSMAATGVPRLVAAEASGPASWDVLAQAAGFAATPDQVRAEHRARPVDPLTGRETAVTDATSALGYAVEPQAAGYVFRVTGHVPDVRTMRWTSPVPSQDLGGAGFFVVQYRVRGQRRDNQPLPVVAVTGADGKGAAVTSPLLDAAEAINDGRWHVLLGRLSAPLQLTALAVQVSTVDSQATLELARCSFHRVLPDVSAAFVHTPETGAALPDFLAVDLSAQFNGEYAAAVDRVLQKHGKCVDGGNPFAADRIVAGGVPFAVRCTGHNVIVPPSDPNVDAGTVKVLGVDLEKRYYYRSAREDLITVPILATASEVCFILVAEMAPTIGRYALPRIPLQLANTDTFVVELVYAAGPPDLAYPYSLADEGHTVQRLVGAYAVSADPTRRLTAVVFHNRFSGAQFDVAALTLNTGPAQVIPAAVREPPVDGVTSVTPPPERTAAWTHAGTRHTLAASGFEAEFDAAQGLALTRLVHRCAPQTPVVVDSVSNIEVQVGERILRAAAFRSEAQATAAGLAVTLTSTDPAIPVRVDLGIGASGPETLLLNARVTNTGSQSLNADIRFPLLRGLRIGALADTWLYFPQCRNVCTSAPGTYLAPNDRPFVTQFLDVFNPAAGVGLGLITHNREHDVLDYSVRKDDHGVTLFVQYPAAYHPLPPGGSVPLVETALVFHPGDWHGALAAYEEWVRTWYRPVKAGGLDWWQRSFALRTHLTAKAYGWTVPIFDPEARDYRIDAILKEDVGYLGRKPQVVHLGGWVDLNNLHSGDFSGGDYAVADYTGGADVLRAAVRKLQADDIRVSVYTIPDRCAKASRIGQRLGRQIAQVKADGRISEDERHWYVCLGAKEWQDHYVEALKRSQRETGVNAVYVDVFGYTRGYACYSREHGHEVPLNVNRVCNRVIRRLREELPEGVAIWSEFLLTDVNSQYTSGNITYYFLTLHEYMVKSYDQTGQAPLFYSPAQSVHRFAFPHVKQFGFPVGFEGGPSSCDLRFLFFNGEGLYDVGWLLYDTRDLARVRNWLGIQIEYADCFASAHPVPLVPTVAGHVFANEFPGEGRTAWTLFNGRFHSYRGPVLTVPHAPGDTYHDAWNHAPLTPQVADGKAVLTVALDPQGLGCVVRTRASGSGR